MAKVVKSPDGKEIDFDDLSSLDYVLDKELFELADKSGLTFEFIKHGSYGAVRCALGFDNKPLIIPSFLRDYLSNDNVISIEEVEKKKAIKRYVERLNILIMYTQGDIHGKNS